MISSLPTPEAKPATGPALTILFVLPGVGAAACGATFITGGSWLLALGSGLMLLLSAWYAAESVVVRQHPLVTGFAVLAPSLALALFPLLRLNTSHLVPVPTFLILVAIGCAVCWLRRRAPLTLGTELSAAYALGFIVTSQIFLAHLAAR